MPEPVATEDRREIESDIEALARNHHVQKPQLEMGMNSDRSDQRRIIFIINDSMERSAWEKDKWREKSWKGEHGQRK